MTSIERTAYPRLPYRFPNDELHEVYTPTQAETTFAEQLARRTQARLVILVLLKCYQRLGYFPRLTEIPRPIIDHVRVCLDLPPKPDEKLTDQTSSLYRYQQAIRSHVKIASYDEAAQACARAAVQEAAQVMVNPADLINVALAELSKQHYELPAFSTLDRLVQRVRTQVNSELFKIILNRLPPEARTRLDALLSSPSRPSTWQRLKEQPKSATLMHLQELYERLEWLRTLGDVDQPLAGVPPAKIRHFAAEARALIADEMRDFTPPKRYTLLLCLIQQERVATRDNVIEMFLKRIAHLHTRAKDELTLIRERQRGSTEALLSMLDQMLQATEEHADEKALGQEVKRLVEARGGASHLREECAAIACYNDNNYLPLLWRFYRSHRPTLFRLVRSLAIHSTTQDTALIAALNFVLTHEQRKADVLPADIRLDFASEQWQRLISVQRDDTLMLDRRHLEVCVFSYLASELKTGDLYVEGSENYADYRAQLVPWAECAPQVSDYCRELGLAANAADFVKQLKDELTQLANKVDEAFPLNTQLEISADGEPVLKRILRQPSPPNLNALESALQARMPARTLLEILCNVQHYTNWTRHFGPLSGSDPKLDLPTERHIMVTFGYGCNLGPAQTAAHLRGRVTAQQLSFVNKRHIDAAKLEAALRDIIRGYRRFRLPTVWGDGKTAAADGTKFSLYQENLLSEYHIRYGGYGGIAYHHVSDTYIALFSHFIACGVWEAIYIIDGMLKNTSDIQPDTVVSDTQGQSTPVFGLAHLLGIKLMPRIRNWKDLIFYRPSKDARYQHLMPLFNKGYIDWALIETHWQDMMQVVLSIKAGKVLPSTLLRKLNNYSRKNKLYQAFRELGRVMRTMFLLRYISDENLRRYITAMTNKVEAYNRFTKWLSFGGEEGVIAENDPEEQEKRIKYTDVVANAAIFQTVVDMTQVLVKLSQEGVPITWEDLAALSPYLTHHIRRFGDYVVDLSQTPPPFKDNLVIPNTGLPKQA